MSAVLGQRRTAPPVARPEGFAPGYVAWEPRFRQSRDTPMFAVIGVEDRGDAGEAVRARMRDTFGDADGPAVLEHGRMRTADGIRTDIWFAYWRAPADYARWAARTDVADFWQDDAMLTGRVGIWREVGSISLDHNETSSSRADDITGLHKLADEIGVTEIHGYWGSARDRIVAAADDPLVGDGIKGNWPTDALGRRVIVDAPHNTCLIRTSQDVGQATPEQGEFYRNDVEPSLMAGVDFLRDTANDSGCIGLRFIDELTDGGGATNRTGAIGLFRSLGSLEGWTHKHPTHDAIMGAFLGMVERFQGNPGLHLWHEVTVFPKGALTGEYINCSMVGGLGA